MPRRTDYPPGYKKNKAAVKTGEKGGFKTRRKPSLPQLEFLEKEEEKNIPKDKQKDKKEDK